MASCMTWCCYEDPYDKQCRKIVMKNKKRVRCQRIGSNYHKHSKKYYCDMHYQEKMKVESPKQPRVSDTDFWRRQSLEFNRRFSMEVTPDSNRESLDSTCYSSSQD